MQGKTYDRTVLAISHWYILDWMKPDATVLEVGCATGFMTRVMTEEMGLKVTAIEIDPAQAEKARPFAQAMIVGDITAPGTWEQIQGRFDCVIFADVLEHLADPWAVLRRTKEVLEPGGNVFASIPNVAYYEIRRDLLRGRFEYARFGILDDTHLRFFTAKTARELFVNSGYDVEGFLPVFWSNKDSALGKVFPNVFARQFAIKAAPVD